MSIEARCLGCLNIMDQIDFNGMTLYDLEEPPVFIVGFCELVTCNSCEEELEPEDYYVRVEDIEEMIELVGGELGEVISRDIDFCSKCEGSEIEYRNCVYEKEFGNSDLSLGSGTDVYDFLGDYNIYTDEIRDAVLRNLECKNCGHGVPDRDGIKSNFEVTDNIYTRQDINKFYGIDIEELNTIGAIYEINFRSGELDDFIEFLYKNPSLALRHETGEKFYDLLSRKFSENEYKLEPGFTLFRGRKRYYDERKLGKGELWNPPEGEASHGRYNSIGVSVFYCSDKFEGIPYELNPLKNECIDYGEFKVNLQLNILDVSKLFPEEFAEYISAASLESKLLKKTYLLTNFISECCKNIGYHGIRYKGVSNKLDYSNFAIFDVEPNNQMTINNITDINTEVSYRIY